MKHRMLAVAIGMAAAGALAAPLTAIYVRVETARVPVARLATNLERQLAANPASADLHVQLARLYGMAYAVNSDEVPAAPLRPGEEPKVWFGHESSLIPYKAAPAPDASRAAASREYLKKSIEHYRAALKLDSGSLLAHLGLAWSQEQAGERQAAVEGYRAVIARAWPKEQQRRAGNVGERFFTQEAAAYLVPLLDPARDAAEIKELRARLEHLDRLPRAITPLAVPLSPDAAVGSIVDVDAKVRFDADGSGRAAEWTWITPKAGWLVYDAEGTGRITTALQMFGTVSFWLFWNDGYSALAALDDNADGELAGAELRFLGIWQDRDSDGVADGGEVRPLAHHGIVALSCRAEQGDGLLVAARSPNGARLENGTSRPTYDVILRRSWRVSAPAPE
jgi:hypothetical protein